MSIIDKVRALKKEEAAEATEVVKANEVQVSAPLTELAMGVYELNGGWGVAHIVFNPATGEARVESTIPVESRGECLERFKIEAARSLKIFTK